MLALQRSGLRNASSRQRCCRDWFPQLEVERLEDRCVPAAILFADVNPGFASSNPESLVDAGGTLYFSADDGVHGTELWKTDGTAAGTGLVKDIQPGIAGSG